MTQVEAQLALLRVQLYTAAQVLRGSDLLELRKLVAEIVTVLGMDDADFAAVATGAETEAVS